MNYFVIKKFFGLILGWFGCEMVAVVAESIDAGSIWLLINEDDRFWKWNCSAKSPDCNFRWFQFTGCGPFNRFIQASVFAIDLINCNWSTIHFFSLYCMALRKYRPIWKCHFLSKSLTFSLSVSLRGNWCKYLLIQSRKTGFPHHPTQSQKK